MGLMRDVLGDLDLLSKSDLMPVAIELGAAEYEEGIRDYLIQESSGASLLFGFPVKIREGVKSGRFYLFRNEKLTAEPKERPVQYVYAIGSRRRECHGHGDHSDELAIRQCVTSNWPACDFAPLFASEEAAIKWIRRNPQFGPGLEPVRLSYIVTIDKEE